MSLTDPGAFVVGCNYWASHAGTAMWSDWQPDVVERDLALLASCGLQTLRVFPLWQDFQPLTAYRSGGGRLRELRVRDSQIEDVPTSGSGVDPVMMDRFGVFAELAESRGLSLVVGLVTGWMSGALFVPPAFSGVNVLTDPCALKWQVRFVRHFVEQMKDRKSIVAWDLGNECNCIAPVPDRDSAWLWTSTISGAIRAVDASRPVLSGMHSLMPEPSLSGGWTIQDQAELTDVLTTHPYPMWCRHANQDRVDSLRTTLHATAESRMYADIGGKPCLVEEVGTMGPMISDDLSAVSFARANLFSLWANDCHGFMWWCGFDQTGLEHPPYEWQAIERELGLFREDGSPKPVALELKAFRQFLDSLPFEALPPRRREAVCILTEGQDQWQAAYGAFVLAKQAGFDLEYQYHDDPLKEAGLYMMPSVRGTSPIGRRRWLELLGVVEKGATLYVSLDDCALSPFVNPAGVEIQWSEVRSAPVEFNLTNDGREESLEAASGRRLGLRATTAEILARETGSGNPVFTRNRHGSGHVYSLGFPVESQVISQVGSFRSGAPSFWRIYRAFAAPHTEGRAVGHLAPEVAITEHDLYDGTRVVVLVNHGEQAYDGALPLGVGWRLGKMLCIGGEIATDTMSIRLRASDAAVLTLVRRH